VLGTGNWGTVEKGILEEHKAAGIPGFLVALKTLKSSEPAAQEELLREAAFMAQLNCDFIVRLHGVVTVRLRGHPGCKGQDLMAWPVWASLQVGEPITAVIEYCEHGSLRSYLQKHDMSTRHSERRTLAHDAARGLHYLASRGAAVAVLYCCRRRKAEQDRSPPGW
jgi:serine/threonine protein kinase